MSSQRSELEDQLSQARANLAADVDALTEKLDVKAQAKGAVADVKAKADERSGLIALALAATAVAAVGLALWRRRS